MRRYKALIPKYTKEQIDVVAIFAAFLINNSRDSEIFGAKLVADSPFGLAYKHLCSNRKPSLPFSQPSENRACCFFSQ